MQRKEMAFSGYVLSVFCFVVMMMTSGRFCAASIDHCQTHLFSDSINSTVMQFTKEAVNQEYAVLNDFKSLHCCAKNYRSIEW